MYTERKMSVKDLGAIQKIRDTLGGRGGRGGGGLAKMSHDNFYLEIITPSTLCDV